MNQCADFLARKGCCLREDFVIFDVSPSEELDKLLVSDVKSILISSLIKNAILTHQKPTLSF